eukprot:CAMPEP_0175134270 /NCGR_PEP_ID=MMETSP0087-20121206/8092_1 /TAXON_ID=136419 /ORGANISM="Unknown Unknown, Strain D1" /LENGTH=276 /DNA_ID=CAMNT_0016416827 /DNA_START=20 /DNA_END=850 /DNA_ORIENTATION=-
MEENRSAYSGFSSINQEQDRIARMIEQVFGELPEEVESKEVLCRAVIGAVNLDCGYEDEDELEDALGCTFEEFVEKLPNFAVSETNGKKYMKFVPDPPESEWVHKKMFFDVEKREDLWLVLYLSRHAWWSIPELEFQVACDGFKKVHNPIYNHIGLAIQNLESFAPGVGDKQAMEATITALMSCLDCDKPFTLCVEDKSGLSTFEDMARVRTEVVTTSSEEAKVESVWQEMSSPDGVPYFYNRETQETVWNRPAELGEEGATEEKKQPEKSAKNEE